MCSSTEGVGVHYVYIAIVIRAFLEFERIHTLSIDVHINIVSFPDVPHLG